MMSKLRQSCQNCVGLRGVAVRKIRVGNYVRDHDVRCARVREVKGKGSGRAFVIRCVDLTEATESLYISYSILQRRRL